MRLLKTERRRARSGRGVLERPPRHVADPKSPHELETGQSSQIVCVPFAKLRIPGLLTHYRIRYERVAEMIHNRCNDEDAAQPFVEALFRDQLLGCGSPSRRHKYSYLGGS